MKLSVIIVNYNVEFFLEQCLYSVYKAAKSISTEVFVVDNNSVDGSIKMLKEKFPDVTLIQNKENTGFSYANNQAIQLAKGEYVLLLNPDTVVEEDTFSKTIHFMDEHPDAGGLGVKMLDGKGNFLPESKRGLPTPAVAFYKISGLAKLFPRSKTFGKYHLGYLDKDKTYEVDVLSGAFMLLRKETLNKIGLLDDTFFMYGEDIDLSYRITQGGYKNYYFADTRIIHYKGESTKKSSVNYVLVFYNAMIIFANKHFSQSNAKLFSFIIKLAVYLRATIAILSRFVKSIAIPTIDFTVVFSGLLVITNYYERNKFQNVTGAYPAHLVYFFFALYTFIWLVNTYFNGGYDKPVKLFKIVRGVLIGSGAILIVYSLLPETYRFSRALILIGTTWALMSLLLLRIIYNFLKIPGYVFGANDSKRIVIVGEAGECERVRQLLLQTNIKAAFVGFISTSDNELAKSNEHTIGNVSQLNDYVHIFNIDEVIFCAKNISAQLIIDQMLQLVNTTVDYKIAPPESLSVIGSNSIDTAGDLYTIDINSITKPENQRVKRILDIFFSLFVLIFSPLLAFVVKSFTGIIKNSMSVLFSKKSWVGYRMQQKNLPTVKNGVLIPSEILGANLSTEIKKQIDLLYAKDYKLTNDFKILIKGFNKIGAK